ncbi:isoprenoid synthase domain-containing protein [Cytidiella melzeri]|nr:isoprenoid synthase domain-containing protein [Cytidiella melzeri]
MGLAADRWKRHYNASINIATVAYSHTRPEVQAHITLFTILVISIDDFVVSDEALDGFSHRLLSGSPQKDPLLDCLVDNLRHMPDYFPSYASKGITVSTIEFIDATLYDKASLGMVLHGAALPYVNLRRMCNALGAAYGFFIWDKFSFPDVSAHIQILPEAMSYLNYGNDILSFYKEQLAGEKNNYLHSRALVTKKDVNVVLVEVVNEVVEAVDRARSVLVGEEEKKVWESFLMGYAAFHYMSPRYKLTELLDGERILC